MSEREENFHQIFGDIRDLVSPKVFETLKRMLVNAPNQMDVRSLENHSRLDEFLQTHESRDLRIGDEGIFNLMHVHVIIVGFEDFDYLSVQNSKTGEIIRIHKDQLFTLYPTR